MKIHEFQAIELFHQAGIPVSPGQIAQNTEEAVRIARDIGYPIVLKAQVLVGGRGKAGGVKVVKNQEELKKVFNQIKGLVIKDYPVDRIFVVRAVEIAKEYYVSITIDPVKNDVVLIASAAGGVDIEETAKTNPEKIKKFYLQQQRQVSEKELKQFIKSISPELDNPAVFDIFQKMIRVFFTYDCSLTEINPLVIDKKGAWLAADAKINFDDNALFRHPDIQALQDLKYEDQDELDAKALNLSFVKLDGNIGCMVNGAGLAMGTVDVIKLLGGDPANFLDVGGSSNPEKVLNAFKIILRNPKVKAILINIFGGITRCDDIANGIVQAREQMNFTVPLVVRLTGTNEDLAKEILAKNKIKTFSTMRESVSEVVKLANKK